MYAVDDRGCRRHEVEMQEAEKPAAKAKAERHRGLGFVFEARIVEPQFGEAVAQPLIVGRIGRKEAAEDDGLHRLKAWERLRRWPAVLGDCVADPAIGDGFDPGGDKADLARPQRLDHHPLWGED